MNTEAKPEEAEAVETKQSAGQRLSSAREALGLSQQQVATRLCLKLSTVKDIEKDIVPCGLATTFFRGYIRSYGRLVHVPEQELLPDLAANVVANSTKITPVRSYSTFGNRRSKQRREHVLRLITILIFLILAGLTFSWWWQNHQSNREEITTPANHSAELSTEEYDASPASPNATSEPAVTANQSAAADNERAPVIQNRTQPLVHNETANQSATPAQAANNGSASSALLNSSATMDNNSSASSNGMKPNRDLLESVGALPVALAMTGTDETKTSNSTLQLAFRGDCWIEVFDANGNKLASGIQRRGTHLNLAGKLPYRLTIGAPGSVDLLFRKQPIDLSRFINKKQIARLTLGTES